MTVTVLITVPREEATSGSAASTEKYPEPRLYDRVRLGRKSLQEGGTQPMDMAEWQESQTASDKVPLLPAETQEEVMRNPQN